MKGVTSNFQQVRSLEEPLAGLRRREAHRKAFILRGRLTFLLEILKHTPVSKICSQEYTKTRDILLSIKTD